MRAAIGNVPSANELSRAYKNKQRIEAPSFERIPTYEAPAYKKFVQDSQAESGGGWDPKDSATFTIDTKKEASDFKFGQTSGGGNLSVPIPWFGFGASASHSESSEILDTSGEESSVIVKIMFDKIEKIDITLGSW